MFEPVIIRFRNHLRRWWTQGFPRLARALFRTGKWGVPAAVLLTTLLAATAQGSLVLNLRFADGSNVMNVTPGQVDNDYEIDVWAKVTGTGGINGAGTHEGITFAHYSLLSQRLQTGTSGSVGGFLTNAENVVPFNQNGNQIGQLAELNNDGITDIGSTASIRNNAFARPRSSTPTFDDNTFATGHAVSDGYEFLLEKVVFHVTDVPLTPLSGAGTRINLVIPNWGGMNGQRAGWYQNSTELGTDGYNSGNYYVGTSVLFQPLTSSIWTQDGSGNWSDSNNWSNGVPNPAADISTIANPSLTQPLQAVLDQSTTLASLTVSSTAGVTVTGPGTLTMQSTTGSASITSTYGDNTIASAVQLNSSTIFDVGGTLTPTDGSLTLTGGLTTAAGTTVTKTGSGTLVLGSNTNFGANTNLVVNGGTLVLGGSLPVNTLASSAPTDTSAVHVPEPATWLQLLLGVGGMLGCLRIRGARTVAC